MKEYDSKFGKLYSFKVEYAGRSAFYSSKSKDQTKFVEGQEAEFTEETKTSDRGTYLVVKPPVKNGQSNYGKALGREQSKYSGFAVSYVKDLIVAGRIDIKEWEFKSREVCKWMVDMDKEFIN